MPFDKLFASYQTTNPMGGTYRPLSYLVINFEGEEINVLRNPTAFDAYEKFAKDAYSTDNIEFLKAVDALYEKTNLNPVDLAAELNTIYERYLKKDSLHEVNMLDPARNAIKEAIANTIKTYAATYSEDKPIITSELTFLNPAISEAIGLMVTNDLRNFKNSVACKNLKNELYPDIATVFKNGMIINGVNVFPENTGKIDPTQPVELEADKVFTAALVGALENERNNFIFLQQIRTLYLEKAKGKEPTPEQLQTLYDTYIKPGATPGLTTAPGFLKKIQDTHAAGLPLNLESFAQVTNATIKLVEASKNIPLESIFRGNSLIVNGVNVFSDDSEQTVQRNKEMKQLEAYMKDEYNDENLSFLTRVYGLYNGKEGMDLKALQEIYDQYFGPSADTPVNISTFVNDRIKAQLAMIKQGLATPTAEIFSSAVIEIIALVKKDALSRATMAQKAFDELKFNEIPDIEQRRVAIDKAIGEKSPYSNPAQKNFYESLLTTAYNDTVAVQNRFEAHNFSKIKNLSKREAAIENARQALTNESPRKKSPVEQEYDNLLLLELEKTQSEKIANEHLKNHKFSKIKDLSKREKAITDAITNADTTKETVGMKDDQFKIYKDLLDKEVQITAKIRFQAHNFSKIKDLEKREAAIRQAIVDVNGTTKSPGEKAYKKLLKSELSKTGGEQKANMYFQGHNFSEFKDLSEREEAIARAITSASNTEMGEKEMGEHGFSIYKGLLAKELQKTQRAQMGIIDKLKSSTVGKFFSSLQGRGRQSVHPVNEDVEQNAPSSDQASYQAPETETPKTPNALNLPTDLEIEEYAEEMGMPVNSKTKPVLIEQIQSEKDFKRQFQLKDAGQPQLAAPAEQKPAPPAPPQDLNPSSLDKTLEVPPGPPKPAKPAKRAKPDTPTSQTTPATPSLESSALLERLIKVEQGIQQLQKTLEAKPENSAGEPLITQQAAQSTPSIQKLVKSSKPPLPMMPQGLEDLKPSIEPSTKLPMPDKPKRPGHA